MTFTTLLFISISVLLSLVTCTKDLNIHHIQFVADHITTSECHKLATILYHTEFEITATRTNNSGSPTDENKNDIKTVVTDTTQPCIALLLKWDRTAGYGKTFNDLILRLGQIKRGDVADRLAKAVYTEETSELERKFLNNPFKKNVPKDSFLLDNKPKKRKQTPVKTDESLDGLEILGIVLGALTIVIVTVYIVQKLFGTAIYKSFRQFAPDFIVKWADMVQSECTFLCKKTKRQFEREVIGTKRQNVSREQLMAMNRNLNNYLNGRYEADVLYYNSLLK